MPADLGCVAKASGGPVEGGGEGNCCSDRVQQVFVPGVGAHHWHQDSHG